MNAASKSAAVNNVANPNVVNRRQAAILEVLESLGAHGLEGERLNHLPTTGGIIDALGLPRDATSYASVSRSLRRMHKAGLVDEYLPQVRAPGSASFWALARRDDG